MRVCGTVCVCLCRTEKTHEKAYRTELNGLMTMTEEVETELLLSEKEEEKQKKKKAYRDIEK